MIDPIKNFIQENNIIFTQRDGITIFKVSMMYEGFKLAREFLYSIVDKKTVLYLSGGRTPKDLYANLANDRKILPGAVALIDERYGKKLHNSSNEKMIQDTGLLYYLEENNIPFYPILQEEHLDLKGTADNYDITVRYLFSGFPKSVGILGIGVDGHIAGIAGNRPLTSSQSVINKAEFYNPMFNPDQKSLFVSFFADLEGPFKERVSMTFLGLSMLDILLVLVFGDEKQNAIDLMFTEGRKEEVPARFLISPEIAEKTVFITDRRV